MVISPVLRGLLGLETNALEHKVVFAPHIPATWSSFSLRNVRVAETSVDFSYRRTIDEITLEIDSHGTAQLQFSPALSPRARVISTEINSHRIPFQTQTTSTDQEAILGTSLQPRKATLRIKLRNDFDIGYSQSLPTLGGGSRDLRVISEVWNAAHDELTLRMSGIAGSRYELDVWNSGQIRSVDGGKLESEKLVVTFPSGNSPTYVPHAVVLHFASGKSMLRGGLLGPASPRNGF
jgi:hypothetical protein